jgi:hypothetical protein
MTQEIIESGNDCPNYKDIQSIMELCETLCQLGKLTSYGQTKVHLKMIEKSGYCSP